MALATLIGNVLAQKRIAAAGIGVSRAKPAPENAIYRTLRGVGYEAFMTHPNTETVEGDPCYPDLTSVSDGVNGIIIATRPEITEQIMHECADLGISHVWAHRNNNFGKGSLSDKTVQFYQDNNIIIIPGAYPMMYCDLVGSSHKCMRWLLDKTGKLPKGNIIHG
jgi:uncharacterized protein